MDNCSGEFPKLGFPSVITFVFARARHSRAKTKVMTLGNLHLWNSPLQLSILIYYAVKTPHSYIRNSLRLFSSPYSANN